MTTLSLDVIRPNPRQPRRRFDQDALRELAESIRSLGLLEPIIVRPDGDSYLIVAGERRWRAAGIAGLDTIPAIVRDDLDDVTAFEISMVENVIRADMTPVEEARGYQALVDAGLTPERIAQRLGVSLTAVHYRLNLLKLAGPILDLVDAGQLGERDAWLMARISHEGQYRVIRAMNAGQLRQPGDLRHLVNAIVQEETQATMFVESEAPVTPVASARATRTLVERLEAAMRDLDSAAAAIEEALVDERTEAIARELKRRAAKVVDSLAGRRVAAQIRQLAVA